MGMPNDQFLSQGRGDAEAQENRLEGGAVAVSGEISVKGAPLSCGDSRILEGYVSPYDATVVARLRQAGVEIANGYFFSQRRKDAEAQECKDAEAQGEMGMGGGVPPSPVPCPLSTARYALMLDTGGEARAAAVSGGGVGLRPSYGRVSRWGALPRASSMDQVGALGRCVADVAALLQVVAGEDPLDGTTLGAPPLRLDLQELRLAGTLALQGLRVGVPAHTPPEVRGAADACARGGAEIVEVSLPHAEYADAAYAIVSAAEEATNLARFDGVRYGYRAPGGGGSVAELFSKSRGGGFSMEQKRQVLLGTYVVGQGCYEEYFLRAQKIRTLIRRDFEEAFKVCDVMMCPVTEVGNEALGVRSVFTVSVSLAGVCALAMPCGGAGLQIVGPAFGEDLVLRAASAYEGVR